MGCKDLKAVVSAQANIYIRPIQQNLSTAPLFEGRIQSTVEVESICSGCKKNFKLRELRKHLEECPGPTNSAFIETNEGESSETVIVVVNGDNNTDLVFTAESITRINMQAENEYGGSILADTPVIETDVHVNQVNNNLDEPPTVLDIVQRAVEELQKENVNNPTEILRRLLMVLVTGRHLEIEDETQCAEGETHFIYVDRENILSTEFDEIKMITDPTKH